MKEIIESVAKTQPGYQVQVSDGIVHVGPSIPDNENFLKTKIGDFTVLDAFVEVAFFKLHSLAGPPRHGNQQISIAGTGDSKVTLELRLAYLLENSPTATDSSSHIAQHGPIQLEACAVPPNHGFWPDEHECVLPWRAEAANDNPEQFVEWT